MLERARQVAVGGQPVTTFDQVDTLLHLGLHAARAGGHRLIWFKDIERSWVVERPDPDELVERARRFRCGPPVGLALARARSLLGVEIPEELVDALLGRPLGRLEQLVTSISPPLRFHERDTLARFLARSLRSSLATSVADLGARSVRSARRLLPRRAHDTGDEVEKEAFLAAVASGSR